jgi:hypothetical protein
MLEPPNRFLYIHIYIYIYYNAGAAQILIFFSRSIVLLASLVAGRSQEAKYIECWPNTTSAWAGWSRFDIPVDRYGGVHSLLICTSSPLGFPTCHQASQQENT